MEQSSSEIFSIQTLSSRPSEDQGQKAETRLEEIPKAVSEAPATQAVEASASQESQQQPSLLEAPSATAEVSDDDVQYLISVPRRKKKKRRKIGSFQAVLPGTQNAMFSRLQSAMLSAQASPQDNRLNSVVIFDNMTTCPSGPSGMLQTSQPSHSPTQFQPPTQDTTSTAITHTDSGTSYQNTARPCQSVSFSQKDWSSGSLDPSTSKRKRTESEGLQTKDAGFQFPYPPPPYPPPATSYTNHVNSLGTNTASRSVPSPETLSLFGPFFSDPRVFNWDTLNWEYPPQAQPTSSATIAQQISPSVVTASEARQPEISPPNTPQQPPNTSVRDPITPKSPQIPRRIQTDPADIRRNPSLYKIPPWNPSTAASSTQSISHQHPNPAQSSHPRNQSSPQISPRTIPAQTIAQPQTSQFHLAQSEHSTIPQFISPTPILPVNQTKYISPYTSASTQSQFSNNQIQQFVGFPPTQTQRGSQRCLVGNHEAQKASQNRSQQYQQRPNTGLTQGLRRLSISHSTPDSPKSSEQGSSSSRGFSPNLIVDIAETCRENFPFEEVAERHNVKLQKVFDTFSAIIQIPLLKNAIDSRRNGPEATRRMREFREAKRAAKEAAEEAKRMAKRRRNSVDVGDNRGRTPGLLKEALLNNAQASPFSQMS